MNRSKKIFLIFALAFVLILAAVVIDMGRRTTFPWDRPAPVPADTIPADSAR